MTSTNTTAYKSKVFQSGVNPLPLDGHELVFSIPRGRNTEHIYAEITWKPMDKAIMLSVTPSDNPRQRWKRVNVPVTVVAIGTGLSPITVQVTAVAGIYRHGERYKVSSSSLIQRKSNEC